MAYTIELKPAAVRDLRKLPADVRQRVAARIDALAIDPTPPGAEALKGELNCFRLRLGDYRILYQMERRSLLVLMIRIGHRREIYRKPR